jgi:excisionase family DNA binding protein
MHEGTHPDRVVAEALAVLDRHTTDVETFAARLPEMCAERDAAYDAVRAVVASIEDDPDAADDLTHRLLTRSPSWERWGELRALIDRAMSGAPWAGDMEALRALGAGTNDVDRPQLISVGEAARVVNVSDNHIRNLIARGELPSVAVGRRRLVPRRAIDDLVSRALAAGGAD